MPGPNISPKGCKPHYPRDAAGIPLMHGKAVWYEAIALIIILSTVGGYLVFLRYFSG